jgi:outer membrane protein OmpA-like peptidoglycan-associated protein
MAATVSTAGAQAYNVPSTLKEAINTPVIKDNKHRNDIANRQVEIATGLYQKNKLNVAMVRDDEVIVISIPADMLFEPNSTFLKDDADDILRQFKSFLNGPDYYRIALAMHHDNTGSPQFCKELTDKRAKSVYDWFAVNASTRFVSYFSMGSTDPIVENNSMQNRRLNRRLDIYIIPGQAMIDLAKKGQLK